MLKIKNHTVLFRFIICLFCFKANTQEKITQLEDSIDKYLYNDIKKANTFNSRLLENAKKNKNNETFITSYLYSAITNELTNELDSTIYYYQKALDISHRADLIIDLKFIIGFIYELKGDYEKALKLYNESLLLASKSNFDRKKEDIRLSIFSIRNKINGILESIPKLENAYHKHSDNKNEIRYYRKKLIEGYVANDLYDKALSYIEEGLIEAQETNNSEYKYYLNELKAKCHLNKKNYSLSEQALEQSLKYANKFGNQLFIDNSNYVLAEVKKNQEKYRESLNLVQDILDNEQSISPHKRSQYYNLIAENYKALDSTDLSSSYYEKSIEERKKASLKRIETLEKIHKISLEEETLETEEQKLKKRNWIIAFSLLLLVAILLFFRDKSIKMKNQAAFDALLLKVKHYENKTARLDIDLIINDLSKEASASIKDKNLEFKTAETKAALSKKNTLNLDKTKVASILKKMKKLEQERYFLKQECNLSNMAKALGTNTSYLSKIVNEKLNKSFSNYINDLRVDYAVVELKNNRRLRAYSITAIAEEFGYKNADSFSNYFKSVTGITPYVYIKKIKSIRTS